MHFFVKMVLDSELIVGSTSYEQKLQLLLLLTQWCGGNVFLVCFKTSHFQSGFSECFIQEAPVLKVQHRK